MAEGAGETIHPRLHCHMADRQQDRFGPRSTGFGAGRRRTRLVSCQPIAALCPCLPCSCVLVQEGRSLASERGLYFTETSALSGDHVDQLLEDVGRYPANQRLRMFGPTKFDH